MTSITRRARRPGTLTQQVCEYLKTNPGEELTRGDIAAKFDVDATSVDSQLRQAELAGVLLRVKSDDSGLVWRLGSAAANIGDPFAAGERAERIARQARRRAIAAIDINGIQVEKGVPLFKQPSRSEQWRNLFDRMVDVQDSFQAPIELKLALAHALQDYRKERHPDRKYSVRKVSDSHVRVWRVA